MASSIKASVDQAVSSSVKADYIVSAGTFAFGTGIPTGAIEEIRALPDVELASPVRFGPFRLTDAYAQRKVAGQAEEAPTGIGATDTAPPGQDDFVLGIEPETFFQVVDLGELQGSPEDLGPGTIAALAKVADDRGWRLGDRIPVYFAETGVQQLELALTFDTDAGTGNYFIPMETFEANSLSLFNVDFLEYVVATPGADLDELRDQLDAIVADSPAITVQDLQEYADAQTAPFDTFLAIVYGLLGLAVIIALIGIANTLSLSVLERTRELGLLRAVGMKRGQLRATIIGESMIIAVFGTLIGLAIGIAFSFALSRVIAADSPDLFHYTLPVLQLVAITLIAAIAGVVAAVLPAWRASRLDVLTAISSV
ncbi:MAG: ABC transporter permease, partial [Microthrixaceae bacterium]